MSLWSTLLLKSSTHPDFSPHNLPYGVAVRPFLLPPFLCTRLGDFVVRLEGIPGLSEGLGGMRTWNEIAGLGAERRRRFRSSLVSALKGWNPVDGEFEKMVFPVGECKMLLPVMIGDYTDFFASRDHATNCGVMFRGKENALQPNWLHLPVGYHGRSSSVVVGPTWVKRPCGQLSEGKSYAPTVKLDFELEIGTIIGGPENAIGTSLSVEQARDRVFGFVLLNDWSARDVQTWEYVPLGPFCAKNFCTTISPWIVPVEALERHKVPVTHQPSDPKQLDYLVDRDPILYDIELFVKLASMDDSNSETIVCKTNMRHLYWTPAQMIAHHTSTGCNLRAGDLLGTGTISGPESSSWGSLLEITWNGTKPFTLNGSPVSTATHNRTFLKDGDIVTMYGRVGNGGGIGFGEVKGLILPATAGRSFI